MAKTWGARVTTETRTNGDFLIVLKDLKGLSYNSMRAALCEAKQMAANEIAQRLVDRFSDQFIAEINMDALKRTVEVAVAESIVKRYDRGAATGARVDG